MSGRPRARPANGRGLEPRTTWVTTRCATSCAIRSERASRRLWCLMSTACSTGSRAGRLGIEPSHSRFLPRAERPVSTAIGPDRSAWVKSRAHLPWFACGPYRLVSCRLAPSRIAHRGVGLPDACTDDRASPVARGWHGLSPSTGGAIVETTTDGGASQRPAVSRPSGEGHPPAPHATWVSRTPIRRATRARSRS